MYSAPALAKSYVNDPRVMWACVAFWTVSDIAISRFLPLTPDLQWAEISNFHSHMVLRGLRPKGTTQRGIPRGYGFDLVSCPNYLFDLLSWLAIAVMTSNWIGKFT